MPGNRQKFAMRNTSMTHLTGWQKKWEGQNFGISKRHQQVWLLKSDMFWLDLQQKTYIFDTSVSFFSSFKLSKLNTA